MSLTLAIETSSINYGVALSTGEDLVAHRTVRRDDPSFRGIGELVAAVLDGAGRAFDEMDRVAVDAGPGNLGSVRAGVAYANGLAFSVDATIFAANSLDLLALEVSGDGGSGLSEPAGSPTLCLRNAGGGNVYAGLYATLSAATPSAGTLAPVFRHGPKELVIKALAGDLPELTVAGTFRGEVAGLLPGVAVKDAGVEFPGVLALHRMVVAAGADPARVVGVASPFTDASAIFGGVPEFDPETDFDTGERR